MQTWAKVGVIFITVVLVAAVAEGTQGKPEVSIKCNSRGDTGTCIIENKGKKAGSVEADVIAVCRDGEHMARVSARVEPGNHATKIIDRFTPSITPKSECVGIDYRNFAVK
jgi:archaellum component FlaG (FlaF/FlaG flagellin family)